jgi:glycosyltransferase involved in cell wall biosynthesis
MAILITHGYLLTGTGSNLYVNNIVRELLKKGEDVILVCQDFDPIKIDFINELYDFSADNKSYNLSAKQDSPFAGNCKCFRPNLNGFLPVYVYDHYEGFEVKEFNSCSDEEVQSYVNQNFLAMDLILQNHEVSVVNTNHMVMFPYVAKLLKDKHDFKFVITVHGSALNFTVKKDKRFENFAIESLKVVDDIVVDSLHADQELKEFLHEVSMEYLIEKMEIIPAGVDISSFGIAQKSRAEMKEDFIVSIQENVTKSTGRSTEVSKRILSANLTIEDPTTLVAVVREAYDYRCIDKDAITRIGSINVGDNNVFFVGKYLWTKGIYLILFGLPEILKQQSNTNLIISGFGPFREPAELILNYLANGNVNGLIEQLKTNSLFHGEDEKVIPLAVSILEKHEKKIVEDIASLDFDIRSKVTFTGILNHAQLVNLLPIMDVLIAPSVFPEAFGMVAIEAASCGVYPVVTYQSAFMEIADQVKELVDGRVDITDVTLDPNASTHIAQNVLAYLSKKETMTKDEMTAFKASLRKLVVDNYSWEGIAGKYLRTFTS